MLICNRANNNTMKNSYAQGLHFVKKIVQFLLITLVCILLKQQKISSVSTINPTSTEIKKVLSTLVSNISNTEIILSIEELI